MIKLEAKEIRNTPIIDLNFFPQQEQFSKIGKALIEFKKYAETHFEEFGKGEIQFSFSASVDVPVVEEVVTFKKPIVEYNDVSLPSKPKELPKEEPIVTEIPEPIVVEPIVVEPVVEPVVEKPKAKKKKVDTKPASI